jgi:hypothetical protein
VACERPAGLTSAAAPVDIAINCVRAPPVAVKSLTFQIMK